LRLRDLGVQFAWIKPGTFRMGNSPTQEEHLRSQQMWDDRSKAEQPVREMVVKEDFISANTRSLRRSGSAVIAESGPFFRTIPVAFSRNYMWVNDEEARTYAELKYALAEE
jgi:hypothetical protein